MLNVPGLIVVGFTVFPLANVELIEEALVLVISIVVVIGACVEVGSFSKMTLDVWLILFEFV